MDTVFGLVVLGLLLLLVVGYSGRKRKPRPQRRTMPPPTEQSQSAAGPVAGWMLGHAVAHDRTGFPGDPLPHGHLGSPANLAFWGGIGADPDAGDGIDADDDLGDDD